MSIETGNYYKHKIHGYTIHVICHINTELFGFVYIVERNDSELLPIHRDDKDLKNYKEIDKDEWVHSC